MYVNNAICDFSVYATLCDFCELRNRISRDLSRSKNCVKNASKSRNVIIIANANTERTAKMTRTCSNDKSSCFGNINLTHLLALFL